MKQFRPLAWRSRGRSSPRSLSVSRRLVRRRRRSAGRCLCRRAGTSVVRPSRSRAGWAFPASARSGFSPTWVVQATNGPGSRAFTAGHRATAASSSRYPAPSMFGIKYRVASRGRATPAYTFDARSQDLVLTTVPNSSGVGTGEALAGRPFTIKVDTTPVLTRRPDLPSPVFAGRDLTLQKRDAQGRWQHVGRHHDRQQWQRIVRGSRNRPRLSGLPGSPGELDEGWQQGRVVPVLPDPSRCSRKCQLFQAPA